MRILYIINKIQNGGAENVIINLILSLQNSKEEVSLLVLSDSEEDKTLAFKLKNTGMDIKTISHRSVYNPLLMLKMQTFISKNCFDIIHVHLFPSCYWVALAQIFTKKKNKLIFTEHSSNNKRVNSIFFINIEKFIYSRYDQIIAVSDTIREKLIKAGFKCPIAVIPNGIDLKQFAESALDLDQKSSCNLFDHKVTLMMTARFAPPKNQEVLIRLLPLLPRQYILVFAGAGINLAYCKNLANKLGLIDRIQFLGTRYDISSLMKVVDINILCSEYEGQSSVAIEAMASGRLFLGSNVPGIQDVVGSVESLFENRNPQKLKEKIIRCIEDSTYSNIIIKTNKQKSEQFSLAEMVKNHLELYNKIGCQTI